jgi:hypothetical protein
VWARARGVLGEFGAGVGGDDESAVFTHGDVFLGNTVVDRDRQTQESTGWRGLLTGGERVLPAVV